MGYLLVELTMHLCHRKVVVFSIKMFDISEIGALNVSNERVKWGSSRMISC